MQCGVRLCEELVGAFVQVEGDVQEVDGLFVGFDGDPQPIVIKDAVYFFFDVYCISRCGVWNRQSTWSMD